jgi:hypothetical protein
MDCLILRHYTSLVLVSPLSDFLILERFSIVNELCAAEIAVSRRRRGILWAVSQPCRGASRRDKSAGLGWSNFCAMAAIRIQWET